MSEEYRITGDVRELIPGIPYPTIRYENIPGMNEEGLSGERLNESLDCLEKAFINRENVRGLLDCAQEFSIAANTSMNLLHATSNIFGAMASSLALGFGKDADECEAVAKGLIDALVHMREALVRTDNLLEGAMTDVLFEILRDLGVEEDEGGEE